MVDGDVEGDAFDSVAQLPVYLKILVHIKSMQMVCVRVRWPDFLPIPT